MRGLVWVSLDWVGGAEVLARKAGTVEDGTEEVAA
jgi:hypothetical protein